MSGISHENIADELDHQGLFTIPGILHGILQVGATEERFGFVSDLILQAGWPGPGAGYITDCFCQKVGNGCKWTAWHDFAYLTLGMYIYIYVYIYICIYMCIYICIYICVYIYICIYIYMYDLHGPKEVSIPY